MFNLNCEIKIIPLLNTIKQSSDCVNDLTSVLHNQEYIRLQTINSLLQTK